MAAILPFLPTIAASLAAAGAGYAASRGGGGGKKYSRSHHKREFRYQSRADKERQERQLQFLQNLAPIQNEFARSQIPIQQEFLEALAPMQEKFAKKNLKLGRKYGMPEEIQKGKFKRKNRLAPEQSKLLKTLNKYAKNIPQSLELGQQPAYQKGLSTLLDQLQGGGEAYEKFAAPHMREYQQNVNQLANRFAGYGAGSSSGFSQALGGAAGSLQEKLGALKAGLQQNALGQSLPFASAPLQARQQQIANALGIAPNALNAQAYETLYRPSTFAGPQGVGIGGGSFSPSSLSGGYGGGGYGVGSGYQPQPGFLSSFGQNAASGLGQGLGQFGANYLQGLFNKPPAPNSTGSFNTGNPGGGFVAG